MNKYRITVNSNGNSNPEFDPDEKMQKGLDVDGFLLMTFRGGDPHGVFLMGVTTLEIARSIAGDKSEAGSVIHQATAIAEGLRKAEEIKKQDDKNRTARELAEMLRRM